MEERQPDEWMSSKLALCNENVTLMYLINVIRRSKQVQLAFSSINNPLRTDQVDRVKRSKSEYYLGSPHKQTEQSQHEEKNSSRWRRAISTYSSASFYFHFCEQEHKKTVSKFIEVCAWRTVREWVRMGTVPLLVVKKWMCMADFFY